MTRTQAYWICQIGGWSLVNGVSLFLLGWSAGEGWNLVLNFGLGTGTGIGLTHAFRAYARRTDWVDLPLRRLVPRILVAALILSILYDGIASGAVYLGLVDVFGPEADKYWTVPRRALSVFGGSMIYGLWLVIYFGVHAVWNYRQAEVDKWKLEAQAETARLKALKLQLNPHFFFNSLNSVRALIAEDPDRAQQMVTRLARLLRTTLQVDDVKTVPLEEELSTVQTYLELETVRFEERLDYRIDASDAALDRAVPFLLVQTLVENGIKHGIAAQQAGGTIGIAATVENEALHLRVTNPGTISSEEGGIGLDNARERLRLLFGSDAALTLQNREADTVEAHVVLPARDEAEPQEALAAASVPDRLSA
jgi:hypothetical protein